MRNRYREDGCLSRRSFIFLLPFSFGLHRFPALPPRPDGDQLGDELRLHLRKVFHRIRLDHRLTTFQPEPTLAEIARLHAQDMLRRRYFDHRSPDGEDMAQRIARGHRRLIGLGGENLWAGTRVSTADLEDLAERIAASLMQSPGHRANILRPNYTHMDLGVQIEGEEIRVVQLFAEIDGYLKHPLPNRLRRGQTINLTVLLVASRHEATRYDLFSLKSNRLAAGPVGLDQPLPDAEPGEYWLRFYFRTFRERELRIVYGPSFQLDGQRL